MSICYKDKIYFCLFLSFYMKTGAFFCDFTHISITSAHFHLRAYSVKHAQKHAKKGGHALYAEASFFTQSYLFSFAKYAFVSDTTTPLREIKAIKFGNAISALKISAMFHTASTVMYGPINTARIYSHL